MDFLSALHEDIFIEVVSYLNSEDMLKASLVCRRWYQMIGQSKECMQKITVKYCSDNCWNNLNPLLKSDRKYQNVIIQCGYRRLLEFGIESKINTILNKFSKSIVNLQTSHDFYQICDFPKLKELILENYCFYNDMGQYFTNGLLALSPNISKLDISIMTNLTVKCLKNLQEAIKNMQNLKSLAVHQIEFFENFPLADCKFKLKEVKVPTFNHIKIVYDFLEHHRSTLKFLNFYELSIQDIAFILSEFPKLHTLRIFILRDNPSEKMEFPANSTIKNLIIGNFIREQITKHVIAEIFTKLKNLQQVSFRVLQSQFIPELFASESLTLVKYKTLSDLVTEDQKNLINTNDKIKFIQIPSDVEL